MKPPALPPALAALGFSDQPIQLQPRVVWDITGADKVGKTRLLTQAPGRIAYQDFDEGAEKTVADNQLDIDGNLRLYRRAAKRAQYGALLTPAELEAAAKADEQTQHQAVKELNLPQVLAVLNGARTIVDSGFFKSYCLDTQDELWSLIRLATFGRLSKVPAHLYDKANADFANFIRTFKQSPMNFIMASKAEDEWITVPDPRGGADKREKSGKKKRSGSDRVGFLVEDYFEARAVSQKKQIMKGSKVEVETTRVFELELVQSANAPHLIGTVWRDEEIQFANIASQIKPDVGPSAWEDAA